MKTPSLHAGILAAGRGERLRRNASDLKPLVKVDGETLIGRVLNAMAQAGAAKVTIIINEDSCAVRDHVIGMQWPFDVRWIIESTPTSMHSFLRLVESLAEGGNEGPFLLSTVDTVAGAQTYRDFIEKARQCQGAAISLALTSPGNDEKPLLVRTSPENSRVIAIGDAAAGSNLATAGIYAVRRIVLREAEAARRDQLDALRSFLGRLLERGYQLVGIPIQESIDVDRPADIAAAEAFLRTTTR